MNILNERSKQVRRDVYKLSKANGGYHYGGTFSCIEILIALFDHVMQPDDRFILSKGHACWGLYVLLREKGFSPLLEGHPHLDITNGIHWTTGSEGHGFPAAVGMALARKLQLQMGQRISGKVYVVIGDGECQEGTTWESMLLAVQHNLSNLIVVVDKNVLQACGPTKDILNIDCLADVANAIGWDVDARDGHNVDELVQCLRLSCNIPHMIIADTVKGAGVSFMEGQAEWHSNWPKPELEAILLEDLR